MPPRVLVVDDNAANLKLASAVLRLAGFDVVTARDAVEAEAELEREIPGAVLLDLQLPGTDGFALARRLRTQPRTKELPLMAVTAYAGEADERRARAAGCDDFVAKPIDSRTLPARVAQLLEKRR